jgi:hypothetical protein
LQVAKGKYVRDNTPGGLLRLQWWRKRASYAEDELMYAHNLPTFRHLRPVSFFFFPFKIGVCAAMFCGVDKLSVMAHIERQLRR